VSIAQASADVDQAFRRSYDAEASPEPGGARQPAALARPAARIAGVRPGAGPDPSLEVRIALWVAGVAVVVLLIACANVANLVLGRAVARGPELAMRSALGAGRARLLSHALAESVWLALASGAGALGVATIASTAIFDILVPGAGPATPATSIRTLAVTGATALLITLMLAWLPALAASRATTTSRLKASGRGGGPPHRRFGAALVVTQTTLSVVLLVGSVLFVRSLNAVRSLPLGYDPDRVLIVNLVIRGATLDVPQRIALRRQLVDAAAALPGVEAASWRTTTPFGLDGQLRFSADGVPDVGRLGRFTPQVATADYFRVMGTRIVRGRGFTTADAGGAPPVVVVSEGMAARLWPGRDPLGHCLRFGNPATAPCTAVVGLAQDVVHSSLTATDRFQYYLPLEQTMPAGGNGLSIRLTGDPARESNRIRLALQPLLPGTSYLSAQPLGNLVSRAHRAWRLGATMFSALGALAVVVAALGLFSLIRYSVVQRLHELGVRAALGASRGDILRLVLAENLRLAIVGIVAGAAVALAAGPRLQPLLFQQSARDPGVYAAVAGLFLVVALAASAAPAIAAARTPPLRMLRSE
jgi:predicted permease